MKNAWLWPFQGIPISKESEVWAEELSLCVACKYEKLLCQNKKK